MSAIITTNKVRREAVDATLSSQKLQLVYRPETHTMAEVVAAINAAAASGAMIYLGPGNFDLNINLTTGSRGFGITGAGRNKTFIRGVAANTPAFITKGLWFSTFENFSISCINGNTTGPVWDIDGEVGVLGIQGNTFSNLTIDARGVADGVRGDYGIAMCRTATNSGQGSENLFLNCHFIGAAKANYYQIGYNALNNTFIGGNFQNYPKHGMLITFGSVHIFSVGFQSNMPGITQIDNDGWDIRIADGGVGDGITVIGCRTESPRFYLGNSSQPPYIINCNQRIALSGWTPNTNYTVYNAGVGSVVTVGQNVYKCILNHTSGATFSAGSNWEPVYFNVVQSLRGAVRNSYWQAGYVVITEDSDNQGREVNATYSMSPVETHLQVYANASGFDVGLPTAQAVPSGHIVRVIRTDNNAANDVRIYGPYFNNDLGAIWDTLTVSRRCAVYMAVGGGWEARRWFILQ